MLPLVLILFGVSIYFGVRYKINIGPLTILIALFVACSYLGHSPIEVLEYIPIRVFFYIVSVTMFYGIAQDNGTMSKMASYVLFRVHRFPRLMPYVFLG